MFIIHGYRRSLHTSCVWLAANSNKSLLAKLRKNTGYTFANCKKALELSNYDIVKAEEWLKEQALALGWAKAAKLSGRSALQGLVAVASDNKSAAMVEINCETDFVSRNSSFQSMAMKVAQSCFSVAKEQSQFHDSIAKVHLDAGQLKTLVGPEGKQLGDEIALLISQVGEKVSLRRATCLKVDNDLLVAGCTHPSTAKTTSTSLGRYGTLLVYKHNSNEKRADDIARQLCQHVIGMNPEKIGDIEKDPPKENKDEETVMIHQEFIMEAETSVYEVLLGSEISLVEFTRYETGEEIVEDKGTSSTNEELRAEVAK